MSDISVKSPPSPWAGLLDEGETIQWQGRPALRLRFHRSAATVLMGLFFMGFSAFWTTLALRITGMNPEFFGLFGMIFPLFGLAFFAIGAFNAFGYAFLEAFRRHYTHYTLTNARAAIATNVPTRDRTLSFYEIDAETHLTYVDGSPPSVRFDGRSFEFIEDARDVFQMMREMQKDGTER